MERGAEEGVPTVGAHMVERELSYSKCKAASTGEPYQALGHVWGFWRRLPAHPTPAALHSSMDGALVRACLHRLCCRPICLCPWCAVYACSFRRPLPACPTGEHACKTSAGMEGHKCQRACKRHVPIDKCYAAHEDSIGYPMKSQLPSKVPSLKPWRAAGPLPRHPRVFPA